MVLSDISEDALALARINIEHNHLEVAKKTNSAADPSHLEYGYDLNFGIRVVQSDLFDGLSVQESTEGKAGQSEKGKQGA